MTTTMTFATRLSKLSYAATQGEWIVSIDGHGAIEDENGETLYYDEGTATEANNKLICLLANSRREILALVELASEARYHMDTLSSNCHDEQLKATYIHLADRITGVFRNLDRTQEGSNVPE